MASELNENSLAAALRLRWTSQYTEQQASIQRFGKALRPLLIFGIAYALAFKYGSGFRENVAAPLWFPDSVLLCAFLLSPRKLWGWYLLVGAPIRLLHATVPVWFLAATYLNDGLKAVLSAYLLQRLIRGPVRLNTLRQFWIYIPIAVISIPVLSALAGAATRLPLGDTFGRGFYHWLLGNATAALVLTPTLLYWWFDGLEEIKTRAALFFPLILILAACLYFTFLSPHSEHSPIILYAPIPLLLLAATTLRPVGVSTAISMLALVSIVSAVEGRGAFFMVQSRNSVLTMQLFLIVISVPLLFVAILMEERKAVEMELKQSQKTLIENYGRIQDLAGKLLNAQEQECRRIGRELHDDINQRLAMLALELEQLQQNPSEIQLRVQGLRKQTSEISNDVQALSHDLHSSKLEYLGVVEGIKSWCKDFSERQRMEIDFESNVFSVIPLDVGVCLFRVLQEAVHNTVKHSGVKRIEVQLTEQSNEVQLVISDSGRGFDVEAAMQGQGLGLTSMRERVRLVNGTFAIDSKPIGGTTIHVLVPIESEHRAQWAV